MGFLGLEEVRWTGCGEVSTDEGHKIWFSEDSSVHQHGVAFLVNKKRVNSVLSCTPISSRLISIRIAAKPHNITLIQVYAPTLDYNEEDIEEFYEELPSILKITPRKDIIII